MNRRKLVYHGILWKEKKKWKETSSILSEEDIIQLQWKWYDQYHDIMNVMKEVLSSL